MAKKPHVTRTYAPLQFEALEPHRFEDLVRDLLYDYRDWQRIEATGRGGSDDGFDIRAYEKAINSARSDVDGDEENDQPVVVEGNLWMIQCKREKELSASRITAIIDDAVKEDSPPYGYVLAAPVNFTKKSYDAFRSALVERGVSEFQLLGRAELEDMLYQPKNDRVLFAFFGISLVSRRRSRVTDIRSSVNNKNKLYKLFGSSGPGRSLNVDVLVRDTNDTFYPHTEKYPDFANKPRWKEYAACAHRPEGIRFHVRKFFAYINQGKKEWDYAPMVDLVPRTWPDEDDESRQAREELHNRVLDFWEHLPLAQQAKRVVDGIIFYRDFDLIDKEGDEKFKMPHLYVEFGDSGPFAGFWDFLARHEEREYVSLNDYKQVSFFPAEFPEVKHGKVHGDRQLEMPTYIAYRLLHGGQHLYFDFDNRYGFLKQRDVIGLPNPEARSDEKLYVEIMYQEHTRVADLLTFDRHYEWEIEQQISRKPESSEELTVLQLRRVYDFQLNRRA